MWVILVLSVFTVADRVIYTYASSNAKQPNRPHDQIVGRWRPDALERVLLDVRARHLAYDVMVIAILAFVWLTPPDWLGDPMA